MATTDSTATTATTEEVPQDTTTTTTAETTENTSAETATTDTTAATTETSTADGTATTTETAAADSTTTTTDTSAAATTDATATTTDGTTSSDATATTTDAAAATTTTTDETATTATDAAATATTTTTTDATAAAAATEEQTTTGTTEEKTANGGEATATEETVEAYVQEAEDLYKTLTAAEDCSSLLRKHLTQAVFDKIKKNKTAAGGTLADCIRSGVENLDSAIGVYACDPEGYKVFADLFDPVIKEYHRLPEKKAISQPPFDLGNPDRLKLENVDPEGQYVVSSRLRLGRSLDGYGFPPVITKESRGEIETKAVEALNALADGLKGSYVKYSEVTAETQQALAAEGLFYDDTDRFLKSAGGYNDWSEGRGLFYTEDKSLVAWVNEEDHLRIFSSGQGGDLLAVYKKLVTAIKGLGEKLTFTRDGRLGFLTFCPSNLGTTMQATVRVKVPFLSDDLQLYMLCERLNLTAIPVEGAPEENGEFNISNRRRLGLTELQSFMELHSGIKEIIKMEKALSWRPQTVSEMYDHLSKAKTCRSPLKRYLTKDTYEKLKETKTALGAGLGNCIISGAVLLDSPVGVYAADAESYTSFAALFDPIIKELHHLKPKDTIAHPAQDFGDLENLGLENPDPEGTKVVSTYITLARSLNESSYWGSLKTENIAAVEQKTVEALNTLEGEAKGTYYKLFDLSTEQRQELIKDALVFFRSNRYLKANGSYSDWPEGRGLFCNEAKTFVAWLNEQDHLRLISTQKDGDIAAVYKRLVTAAKSLEEKLQFAKLERLGYLNASPCDVGTGMRLFVQVKLPALSAQKNFKSTCDNLKLFSKPVEGGKEEGLIELSNKRCVGLTEIEAAKEMAAGVKELIRLDEEAANSRGFRCAIL